MKTNLICHKGTKTHKFTSLLSIIFFLFSIFSFSQQPKDSTKVDQLDEVFVKPTRVNEKSPFAFSDLSKNEIAKRNLGQDIPILMNFLPSVVTTSDAGNGFGYTGIRVRGSDATRVNVTVNGIPYNDSESQGTFFVNMPDFASSLQSVQLQRGAGTSTNGSGAFGASLNMLTDNYSEISNGEISNSFGSFNSRKHTVKFSTGLMNNHFEIAGRLSNLHSDGFIDRAFSDLKGYFLQGTYVGKTTLIKAMIFGGTEKTYQAYYGLEDPEKLENNRTFNVVGQKYDSEGNFQGFYENEVDDYQQDHYQLHWNQKLSKNWNANLAFHYTKGKGFFEQYIDDWYYTNLLFKKDATFNFLGINPIIVNGNELNSMDYIRKRWLDNDFYGTTFSANYKDEKLDFIFGGSANKYEGKHFGEIVWAEYANQLPYKKNYYNDFATKTDGTFFAKATYKINQKFDLFGDLQFRKVNYKANFKPNNPIDENFNFINPKAGITYFVNKNQNIYFSYAKANREPNRTDYENGTPKPESLDDFELGWRFVNKKTQLNLNFFYMAYQNQLVLTGAIDNVGAPIRKNVGNSYRLGLEIDASLKVSDKIEINPNITLSQNKNKDFYFQRDGVLQNLGNTSIAFSPNLIFGNQLIFRPIDNLNISLLSKFVSQQFMGNIDARKSVLSIYAINDLSVNYEIKTKSIFKSISINGLVNNIFNQKYSSNGYFYTFDDDYSNPGTITTVEGAGFYPQAGSNFLLGIILKF